MTVIPQRLVPYLFVLPAIILLVVFVYGPAIENVIYSFYAWSSMSPDWRFVGFGNYAELFGNPIFWTALFNNIVYAVVSVVFQVAFAHGDVGSGLPLFLLALGVILYVHRRRHWPPFALRR